jgi:hypothetical protein
MKIVPQKMWRHSDEMSGNDSRLTVYISDVDKTILCDIWWSFGFLFRKICKLKDIHCRTFVNKASIKILFVSPVRLNSLTYG